MKKSKADELTIKALHSLGKDKIKKACHTIKEHLKIDLSVDDIIKFLKEKNLESE